MAVPEDRAACPAFYHAQGHVEHPLFLLSQGIKVAARLKLPTNHPSFWLPTPLQHRRGFPNAGATSISQESCFCYSTNRTQSRSLGFHSMPEGAGTLERGPPSHPRSSLELWGIAVASPKPYKEARYTPGPWPADAQDYTWKSSAAGSTSASVAAGPDQE